MITIQRFVDALKEANAALEAVDRGEADALLERWYRHRTQYVLPYGPGTTVGDEPMFQPHWSDLMLEDSDKESLHFKRHRFGETDYVFVDTAYFLDPDGWIAKDKETRVTRKTRERQRDRALQAQARERLEKQAEALRKAGYKVEKS